MDCSNNNNGVRPLGVNDKYAFVAPHELATQAGLAVLERGGHAVDAMISAAAMIAVAYPHMNSLGGDGFGWCMNRGRDHGQLTQAVVPQSERKQSGIKNNCEVIPNRGPLGAYNGGHSIRMVRG